jgi:hypothetical protein
LRAEPRIASLPLYAKARRPQPDLLAHRRRLLRFVGHQPASKQGRGGDWLPVRRFLVRRTVIVYRCVHLVLFATSELVSQLLQMRECEVAGHLTEIGSMVRRLNV